MRRDYWYIIGLSLILFIPLLGEVHLFDWDEINFAECAREMLMTGDWMRPQIDFEPFWEKPPLFLWMQAISMHIFGVNEFAARLPNAICGMATLVIIYKIGVRLYDRSFAWIWVLAWIGSILPHLYFKSGIIDPWFNLFIFLGLYGFIEFRWRFFKLREKSSKWLQYRHLIIGGILLGLAVLTKGPVALLIAILVLGIYWMAHRFKKKCYLKDTILFGSIALLSASIWFMVEWWQHGSWFITEFVKYQIRLFQIKDAGHGGFFGYHVVVLLLGCFPASIFALPNLWGDGQCQDEVLECDTMDCCRRSDFSTWMQILFWTVLILFSVVSTKIVHYSSLCYFPLTFLASVTLWRASTWHEFPKRFIHLLPVIGALLGIVTMLLPYLGTNIDLLQGLLSKDKFALANLEVEVQWTWFHSLPGLILFISSIFAYRFWLKEKIWYSIQSAFVGGTIFTALTLMFVAENIEAYSQRAAIEFYKSKCGEDCFIKTIGFKSFAHLFYACKKPVGDNKKIDDYESLSRGKLTKTVYFVTKVTTIGETPQLPNCHEIYRKNGFVFFERKP